MVNLIGDSADGTVAAIKGENLGSGGFGVHGICATGHGVRGDSRDSRGVVGTTEKNVGVLGTSGTGEGVVGISTKGRGVVGEGGPGSFGVHGICASGNGVRGESKASRGVVGTSEASSGVMGTSVTGDGVVGNGRRGVVGESATFQGVFGKSTENAGVVGESASFHAVFGESHSRNNGGLFGANTAGGFGVIGRSDSGNSGIGVFGSGTRLAARFEGDVEVTGDIRLLHADCAENFDVADDVEPGTVMVLSNDGALRESHRAYDKRVAGVISGAGSYKPGIVLDTHDSQTRRLPIGLLGKVFCKVEAHSSSVEVGDLLTTSGIPGHAMKASNPFEAFGAVIGKALSPLKGGQGLIPILISLQ